MYYEVLFTITCYYLLLRTTIYYYVILFNINYHHLLLQGWLWLRYATVTQTARIVDRLDGKVIENGRFHMHATQSSASTWPPGMTPPRLVGRGPAERMPDHVHAKYMAAKAAGKHIPGGGFRRRSDIGLATPLSAARKASLPQPPQ